MASSSTEKELSALSKLMICWNEDWQNTRPSFDDWMNDYLAYKMYRDPNSHPYKYNPTIPLVFTITENKVSTSFNNFFMKENPFLIQPVAGNQIVNDEVIARQLERVLNTVIMHPDLEFQLEKYDLDMETTIFGNGYTMTVPEFDYEQESDIGGPLYIGPRIKHVSIWDLIPDKECYRLTKGGNCRRLWHKEWISTEEYKRRAEKSGYKKFKEDELKKLSSDKTWLSEQEYHEDLQAKLGVGSRPEDGYDDKNGNILLLHYYDMDTGHYTTIAANRMIVRDTSNPTTVDTPLGPIKIALKPYPYCPYDDIRLWPFPKEFFARGVGRIARGFQDEINLLKSMRLDNLELGIFKTFQVNELFVDELDDIMMLPGGIVPVKDVNNAIKPIEVGDITQNAYTEQAMWEKEAQDATSSQETMRGNAPARRETATTVVQLQRNGQIRTESFDKRVGHWAKSVGTKAVIQIRTYMSQSEYERILGEPDAGFYQLTVNEIKRGFDLRPSSASLSQVREIDQQNFVQVMQMVKEAPQYFNIPALASLGFELFFPTKTPSKYVLTQEQLMMQQQQMAQQSAQGSPPPAQDGSVGYGQPTISPSQLIDLAGQGQLGGS